MAGTKLKLGDFTFQDFEIPDSITIGGAQLLALHKLPGGERIIDSLGRDDAPLAWEGLLRGTEAYNRAKYLDAYRIKGDPLTLTWDTFRYRVVVHEFTAKYERKWHIPYRITLEVIEDLTTPVTKIATDKSLDTVINDSVAEAVSLTESFKTTSTTGVTTYLSTIKKYVSNFRNAYAKAMQGLASVVNLETLIISSLQGMIDTSLESTAACKALINTATNASSLLFLNGTQINTASTNPGITGAAILTQLAADLPNLVILENIEVKLKTIKRNLGYINGMPNAKEITVVGGSLIDLAVQYYKDASKWTALAEANDLHDPVLSGVNTVIIPPVETTPATYGGGYDVDHWYGDDVQLSSKNDLNPVISSDKTTQRIIRRLMTNPGAYVWHLDYGAGILEHVGDTMANLGIIEGLCVAQVQLEHGVASQPPPAVAFEMNGDMLTVKVEYTDQDTNSRQFLSFTVDA